MVSDNGDIRRGFWFIIDGIDGGILIYSTVPGSTKTESKIAFNK